MSGVRQERSASLTAGRGRGRAPWVVGTLLAGAVLMFCYLRIAGVTQVNSDGAGLVWQASDMLHGNVLLHGWWMTDVSFYTTELPEYLVVTAFAGIRPEVVHICSALTYTMLVLLAAFVARGRARGAEGLIRAVIAAVIILAPQPTGPTLVVLGNPDHVGSGVPVLVLLLLLDWASARPRWWVPVAAGVLLAWSIVGDPLIEVVGAAPLFAACVLRAVWIVRAKRVTGQEAEPSAPGSVLRRVWSAAWYEWSLALAAAAAFGVAVGANRLIVALGGFTMARPAYGVQSLNEMLHGLRIAGQSVLVLFGADFQTVTGAGNVAFALVHLIGVAVVLAGFCLGVRYLVRPFVRSRAPRREGAAAPVPGDLVTDFLVLAIVANFVAFILEVKMVNVYAAHEIAPLLSIGAALAGRTLGSRIYAARAAADPAPEGPAPEDAAGRGSQATAARPPGRRRVLLAAVAAVVACYVVMLGIAAAHKQAPPRNVALAKWLTKQHLTSGFAPYWEASSVWVDTGGAIKLLSVAETGWHGRLAPQKWETNALLTNTMPPASFVIFSPAERVHVPVAIAMFGKPDMTYRDKPFTILVWHKNLVPAMKKADKRPGPQTVSLTVPGR